MPNEELVKVEGALAVPADNSAFEVDFGQIKKITPYTLSIDQPMSEKEGVQPGMLRIVETGQLRKEFKVVLIQKPRESRSFDIGKYPNAKRVCFSRDMVKPDAQAQDPQAMACAGCKHASWLKFNKTKSADDAPGCKITSQVIAIDYDNLYPVQSYIRGKSRTDGLEDGLQQVIAQFVALKMKNGTVAWTDVIMTLTTEKQKGNPNYKLKIKDVHPLTTEEREHLSGIIALVGLQKAQMLARIEENKAAAEKSAVDDSVTKAVSEAVSGPVEGEYVETKGTIEEV